MRLWGSGVLVALVLLVMSAPASATGLLSQTVAAASALDKSCTSGERTGTSVAQRRVVMPLGGEITASLTSASGDWDLAIIDPSDGRIVAGSAYEGANEVASGFAATGNSLIVQACRRSGSSSTAQLSVQSLPDRHDGEREGVARPRADGQPRPEEPAERPRARPVGARRPRLRRGGAVRPGRRPEADRQQLRLHDPGPGPERAGAPGPRGRCPLRGGERALRPAERPHHLPAAVRLQRGHEGAGEGQPGPGPPDHAEPQDVRGPPGRGHRDRDERERPRRPADVPPARRAPRARVALGRARHGVGVRAGERLHGRRRPRARPRVADAHDRRPDRQPRRLQREPRGRRAVRERRRPRHGPGRRRGDLGSRVHRRVDHAHQRVPPQELPLPGHRRRRGRGQLHGAARPGRRRRRRRPEPQLRRVLGRQRRRATRTSSRTTAAPARSRSRSRRTSASSSRTARS